MPGCRYKPQGVLAALVECLWYWEGAPGPHLQERLLPNGEAAMILNLRLRFMKMTAAWAAMVMPFFPGHARTASPSIAISRSA